MERDGGRAQAQQGEAWPATRENAAASDDFFAVPPGTLDLRLLFDELDFGIAVVDGRRRLVHANRAALAQLHGGCGLRLAGGLLECGSERDGAALERAVDAACRGRRGYVPLGSDGAKFDIAVVPLSVDKAGAAHLVAVMFERHARAGGLALYFFAQASSLTSAEERLLAALADGLGVAAAARRLGCSPNTARTHVRSVLAKTGQPTLRALIGRIGRLPPVAPRSGAGIAHFPAETATASTARRRAPPRPGARAAR